MRRYVILALCALGVFYVAFTVYRGTHQNAPRPIAVPSAFMATASRAAAVVAVTPVAFSLDNQPVRYNIYDSSGVTGARGLYAIGSLAGDSLRVVVTWQHPTDGGGNEDSTTFRIKASRTIRFMPGGTTAPDTYRRRMWKATTTADTFKVLAPLPGDSAIFQADSIQQFRKGDASVPGSAAWTYKRSNAPPSMTFSTVVKELF